MACGTPPLDAEHGAPAGAADRLSSPLVERQLAALGELIDIGLKIARAIERQVDAVAAEPQSVADLNAAAMAYARVARAVRQSILLQSRLVEEPRAGGPAAASGADRETSARARLDRALRREIESGRDDHEQVERLVAEAAERLDRELEDAPLDRPLYEIIGDICQDLGVRPDWLRLFPELSAIEDIRSGVDPTSGEPGPIELYWLDHDGRPTPASKLCAAARHDSS